MDKINSETTVYLKKDGYWLYDSNRGMNLSMRAKSKEAALIKALEYYQRRLKKAEGENSQLKNYLEKSLTDALKQNEEFGLVYIPEDRDY